MYWLHFSFKFSNKRNKFFDRLHFGLKQVAIDGRVRYSQVDMWARQAGDSLPG